MEEYRQNFKKLSQIALRSVQIHKQSAPIPANSQDLVKLALEAVKEEKA